MTAVAAALVSAGWAQAAPGATELPTGGSVVAGQASLSTSGATLTVQQGSARAAIDWATFNVGSQAQVTFQQPSTSSVTLNRVLDTNASQIFGRISANGQVFLSNPAGIYFSPSASVEVGGLVATTGTIGTDAFMAGSNRFSDAAGGVVNEGLLQADLRGYIALLAPEVRNTGTIVARLGTVALAAGQAFELQFGTDQALTGVRVEATSLQALVENRHAVLAPGGRVILSAQALDRLQGGVVNNSGTIEASGLVEQGGVIRLEATDRIEQSGTLSAADVRLSASQGDGQSAVILQSGVIRAEGGQIALQAERAVLQTGTLDASGLAGGRVEITTRHLIDAGSTLAQGVEAGGTVVIEASGTVQQTTAARLSVDGGTNGGQVRLSAGDSAWLSGQISANGAAGAGGEIALTAAGTLTLAQTQVTATGATAGGHIRIGGDWHGAQTDLAHAQNTRVVAAQIDASATTHGDAGSVVVWSEQQTQFDGTITATGGAQGGNGGQVEVSSRETLAYAGQVDTRAAQGRTGSLLLDPKNIQIVDAVSGLSILNLADPTTSTTESFGSGAVVELLNNGVSTNRLVVASPGDDTLATNAGAVYLYDSRTGALVSTLRGSRAADQVGSGGVTALTNGNFVVISPNWSSAGFSSVGAATWGNGATGLTGVVSSANSLVGSTASDQAGLGGVTALSNGNYVVNSYNWDSGAIVNAGAVTWGSGTAGVSGTISSTNSLVGGKAGDQIGSRGVTALNNGHYVVASPGWDSAEVADAGAATWVNGLTGLTGFVSSANSLVGSTAGDQVGSAGVTALSNGNYVVASPLWNSGAIVDAGAATWGNGSTGTTGVVSGANSLVGSTASDQVGSGGVTALNNGHYVVVSPLWDDGAAADAGAATWGNGSTGMTGVVSSATSLVGGKASDQVGVGGVTALSNGNYVVNSYNWGNGAISKAGAVTWGNGSTGTTGVVTTTNSLVGSKADDQVGLGGITALSNGNYVVSSYLWDNGTTVDAGAATWASGSTGAVGTVSATNSLVGSTASDQVSYNVYGSGVTALSNGNYVVTSYLWDSGAIANAGAATWGSGTSGVTGTITSANSLVGSTAGDQVGNRNVTALTNGNYVVRSSWWDNGAIANAGAATWGNGTTGVTGAVSSTNSLVGSSNNDYVSSGGVVALSGGNYIVNSPWWSYEAGAVTWGNGTTGTTGAISSTNSWLASTRETSGGYTTMPVVALSDGRAVVRAPTASSGAGQVAILSGPGSISLASSYGASPGADSRLLASDLASQLATSNVTLQANNDITLSTALTVAGSSGGTLTLQAGRSISLGASISTANGNLVLIANDRASSGVVDAYREAGAASITQAQGTTINAGTGTVSIDLRDGAGLTYSTAGNITLASILASGLTVQSQGFAASAVASSRTYDGSAVATLSSSSLSGLTLQSGSNLTLNRPTTGLFADKNVGTGKTVTSGAFTLSGFSGAATSALQQGGAPLVALATASITPATLTVSGTTAANKVYDATTAATVSGGLLSGLIGGDAVTLSQSGTFADKNAGTGKTVTVANSVAGADASNYVLSNASQTTTASIAQATLTVAGTTAANKVYDATTAATVSGGVLSGLISGDAVTLAQSGTFADKNAGTGKTVTVANSVAGADASNYVLSNASQTTTANIAQATLTVAGTTAANKVYDATTAATVSGGVLSGLISGDAVTLSQSGTFADKNAGTGKTVTVANTLSGTDASNYTVAASTTTASIAQATLTVSGTTAANKVYDAMTAATVSGGMLSGVISGDAVTLSQSGAFADKNVGTGKTVTVVNSVAGADAGNYMLSNASQTSSAAITAATLTVAGTTAANKVYDATTAATVSGGVLSGLISGDAVTLSQSGAFADKNVGTGKTVTVANSVAGADAGNYMLGNPSQTTTATITAATLTVSGTTAQDKVYDATTAATVSGGTLSGVLAGDAVTLATQTGAFADKNVGAGKTVSITSTLAGADAGNYVATLDTTRASITPATLTVLGTTAADKVYDATTAATVSGGVIAGALGGDAVTLASQTGAFADPQVGTGKTVFVSNTLSGADAGNYVVSSSQAQAAILAATVVVAGGSTTAGGGDTPVVTTVVTSPAAGGADTPVAVVTPVPVAPAVTGEATPATAFVTVTPLREAPNPVPIEALPAMAEAMVMLEPTAGVTLQASRNEASLVQVMLPAGFNPLFPGALRVALPPVVLDQSTPQDPVRVTLTDGSPLPQWVRYDSLTGSLSFLSAPPQAWPLEVLVAVGQNKRIVRLQQPTLWAAQE